MTQREEFETFWKENMNVELLPLHRTRYPFTPDCDQQYLCHETNRSWFTWQAAKAQTVSQWIPVSERLPEYGVAVFVVIDGIFKLIPFKRVCFGGVWWWESVISSTCMLYDISDVTHWMPLPELPDVVK